MSTITLSQIDQAILKRVSSVLFPGSGGGGGGRDKVLAACQAAGLSASEERLIGIVAGCDGDETRLTSAIADAGLKLSRTVVISRVAAGLDKVRRNLN